MINEKSSADEVVDAFRVAYKDYRIKCVEQAILSPINMTLKEFLKSGLGALGETEFAKMLEEVLRYDINYSYLIGGWGADDFRSIFTVENPGVVTHHEIIGAHAIGEGAQLAIGHLYATYNRWSPTRDVAYRAFEAKFVAEATRSVGPATLGYILSQDGTFFTIPYADIDAMRRLWMDKRKIVDGAIAAKITVPPAPPPAEPPAAPA
jgi:hypothetical protein